MKKISRRSFLQITGLAIGASALPMPVKWLGAGKAEAFYQTSLSIPLYGQALRLTEIPIAIPNPLGAELMGPGSKQEWAQNEVLGTFPYGFPQYGLTAAAVGVAQNGAPTTGVRHYTLTVKKFQDKILPPALYTGVGNTGTNLYGFHPNLTLVEGLSALGFIQSGNPFYINPIDPDPLIAARQAMAHLGGIILAEGASNGVTSKPIQMTMINSLPLTHIIPNDLTIPGANKGADRFAVHFHGGLMPWIADGGPFDWFSSTARTSNIVTGESFLNNQVLNSGAPNTQGEYFYNTDRQSARFVWYHDHSWGITRINAYAGAASGIIIRDNYERGLVASKGLPPLLENTLLETVQYLNPTPPVDPKVYGTIVEYPLVFQDKIFTDSKINLKDPTWPGPKFVGSLWYPHTYESTRWRRNSKPGNVPARSLPTQSVIAEMFGDVMLVNGASSPTLTVEPRRYRFRMLNACNARFLNLQLYLANTGTGTVQHGGMRLTAEGVATNTPFKNAAVPAGYGPAGNSQQYWLQVGCEGGFLTNVAAVSSSTPYAAVNNSGDEQISLLVGCAERPDVIVDFSNYADGTQIILYSDSASPFPGSAGDSRNDYFPGLINGNVMNTGANALLGRNTRCIMRFTVGAAASDPQDAVLGLTPGLDLTTAVPGQRWNDPQIITQKANGVYAIVSTGSGLALNWTSIDGIGLTAPNGRFNKLSLDEEFDAYGRLEQRVGSLASAPGGKLYIDPIQPATDVAQNGNVEVWAIYNTTADVHPMHFHMSNWQLIGRQTHNNTPGSYALTGSMMGPRPNEFGWKETVLCYPGEVAFIIGKWEIPPIYGPTRTSLNPPYSPRFQAGGTGAFSDPSWDAQETVWHCHILEHEEHDMMRPVLLQGLVPGALAAPTISVSPSSIVIGAPPKLVTITGTNLFGVISVVFSNATATIVSESTTQIIAMVTGTTANVGTVTVNTYSGNPSAAFTVISE